MEPRGSIQEVTFQDFYEALLTVEPPLTALCAARATRSNLDRLIANLEEQERSVADISEWSELDEQYHRRIAEAAHNIALVEARAPIGGLASPTLRYFLEMRPVAERGLEFHREILVAILRGEEEKAAALARKHVKDYLVGWEKAGLSPLTVIGEVFVAASAGLGGGGRSLN